MVQYLRTPVKQQACRSDNSLINNVKRGNFPPNRQLFPDRNCLGWETLTPGGGRGEIAAVEFRSVGQSIPRMARQHPDQVSPGSAGAVGAAPLSAAAPSSSRPATPYS